MASTTAEDLRAMAQDMLRMGTHWAQAAQDWLDHRSSDLGGRGSRSKCAPRADRDFQGDFSGGGYDQVGRGTGYQARYASASTRTGTGYRGVGPTNYTRSDDRIREDLNDRLTEADDLDASGITVEVSNGVATLGGSVEQRWMKHRAEDIADGCLGVRDVRNQISVAGSATGAEVSGSARFGNASAEVHGSMATGVGASSGTGSGTGSGSPTSTGTNTRQDSSSPH